MIQSFTEDSDWLINVLNQTGLNREAIQEEVDYLLWEHEFEHPDATDHEKAKNVCHKLIVWSSSKTATSATVTTAPTTLPILGSIGTATVGTTVDLIFLVRTQIELCYAIAAVYHVNMTDLELKATILALLGYSDNIDLAKDITKTTIHQLINGMATTFIARGLKESSIEIIERLTIRFFGRMVRWIPFISIPIVISMNVKAIRSIGANAQRFFEKK